MTIQSLFREDDTLVAGSLLGYRSWALTDVGELASTAMQYVWPPGTVSAQCLRVPECGHAPNGRCTCGFYAWYEPDDDRMVRGPVFGAVRAHGRILLGSHGFRAERVEVVAVACSLALVRDILMSRGYRVYASRDELLSAHPPEDVSALVQHSCDERCTARLAWTRPPSVTPVVSPAFAARLAQRRRPQDKWSLYRRARGLLLGGGRHART